MHLAVALPDSGDDVHELRSFAVLHDLDWRQCGVLNAAFVFRELAGVASFEDWVSVWMSSSRGDGVDEVRLRFPRPADDHVTVKG
uniref:Uncharacterized protein n=1 Tax=Physcomitrium patens TaxID=3218 RepID=A0A2K1KPS3_PHYPA|nr:hypothetical protein PHYPA_006648 [Physcomitrium patens]